MTDWGSHSRDERRAIRHSDGNTPFVGEDGATASSRVVNIFCVFWSTYVAANIHRSYHPDRIFTGHVSVVSFLLERTGSVFPTVHTVNIIDLLEVGCGDSKHAT